jgi:hypothetical protein
MLSLSRSCRSHLATLLICLKERGKHFSATSFSLRSIQGLTFSVVADVSSVGTIAMSRN